MSGKINVDVRPRGIASAYIAAPFDKAKEALEKEGYAIISLQEKPFNLYIEKKIEGF